MRRYWIKLELKILYDPKMSRMPNYLWRRTLELAMLAGEHGDDGLLGPVADMAYVLRIEESDLDKSLRTLSEIGIVHETPQGWVVTNFKESQAAISSTERVQAYRQRRGVGKKMKRKGNEDETEEERSPSSSTSSVSNSNSSSISNSISTSDPDSDIDSDSGSDDDAETDTLEDEVQEQVAANAFAVYEANIGALTPILADAIRADIDDFSEAWVCDAILEAVKSNARSLKYVEAILKRWQKDGRGSKKRTQDAEDRRRYITGKYADWINH
ncbi:MAG: DnaD domain protein [Chloroflexota bacterium]